MKIFIYSQQIFAELFLCIRHYTSSDYAEFNRASKNPPPPRTHIPVKGVGNKGISKIHKMLATEK